MVIHNSKVKRIQYNSGYATNLLSYANNIHTYEGGTHEDGFKRA
ncbi:hypothetical protein, partial [Streptococcus pneumoniae]